MNERDLHRALLCVNCLFLREVGIEDLDALQTSQESRNLAADALKLPPGAILLRARWDGLERGLDQMAFCVVHRDLPEVAKPGERLPEVQAEFQSIDGVTSFRRWNPVEQPDPVRVGYS